MAQPGRPDPHQHLARPGRIELELLDRERHRLGVRPRTADLGDDGGFDLHESPLPPS
jgi:hypothetical protein